MNDEKTVDSIIETSTKMLIEDIIDNVRSELINTKNDIDGYLLGLEIINHLYNALLNGNLDRMIEIDYIYRNKGIFSLQEELNT